MNHRAIFVRVAVVVRVIVAAAVVTASIDTVQAGDWPSWRGPEQNGVSREVDLPATWSPMGEGLAWKLPGYGSRSAPVAHGGRVYVFCAGGSTPQTLHERVVAVDAEAGTVLWEHRMNVFLTDIVEHRIAWANPAVDVETGNVYVHGAQGLLVCLNPAGKVVWERSLTEEYGRVSGYGGRTNTPIIDENRLVISFLNASWGADARGKHRFLALDKRMGEVIWWSDPGDAPLDTTYSTPVVAVVGGVRLLVAGCADGTITALKARTGEKVWSFRLSKLGINASVVVSGDRVYAGHSEENLDRPTLGRFVCIDATGKGDVSKTHEVWRVDELGAGYSSPAIDGGRLYVIDNSANLFCLDPATGKKLWTHNAGTVMKASPVVADGKIYVGNVSASFLILKPEESGCRTLSEVNFKGADGLIPEINGSACVADGKVFFVTKDTLFAIGKRRSAPAPQSIRADVVAEVPADPSAKPARLELVPGDVVLEAGGTQEIRANVYDAAGRLVRAVKPQLSLAGVQGTLSTEGRLGIAASSSFQGGSLKAVYEGLEAQSRVRVVPRVPFTYDFEAVEPGKLPGGWVGASPVKFQVVRESADGGAAGNNVLKKLADNPRFLDADVFVGLSSWRDYSVQVDVKATEKRRQLGNAGILLNRYHFLLMGNQQRAKVVGWTAMPRVKKEAPFRWEGDVWYRMKLRLDPSPAQGPYGPQGVLRAKAWRRDAPEPEAWTLELEDPMPQWNGSPGLHAYSAGTTEQRPGSEIFFDNFVVTHEPAKSQ